MLRSSERSSLSWRFHPLSVGTKSTKHPSATNCSFTNCATASRSRMYSTTSDAVTTPKISPNTRPAYAAATLKTPRGLLRAASTNAHSLTSVPKIPTGHQASRGSGQTHSPDHGSANLTPIVFHRIGQRSLVAQAENLHKGERPHATRPRGPTPASDRLWYGAGHDRRSEGWARASLRHLCRPMSAKPCRCSIWLRTGGTDHASARST